MLRRCARLLKGEMTVNILHDCNPQWGAPYNTTDRVMKEDEFHDFLASVRGWTVLDSGAITKRFEFPDYMMVYEWMGRVMGFGYTCDRYPRLHWDGTFVTATVYSGHFRGITNREARLAAFMNDQCNLIKRAAEQRDNLFATITQSAAQAGFDANAVRHAPTVAEREAALHAQARVPLEGDDANWQPPSVTDEAASAMATDTSQEEEQPQRNVS
jgi:pterin-4a-carbinolamine dehydratase